MFVMSDVEKVCMEPLADGIFCLPHILFMPCFAGDQVDEVRAFTNYFRLARY